MGFTCFTFNLWMLHVKQWNCEPKSINYPVSSKVFLVFKKYLKDLSTMLAKKRLIIFQDITSEKNTKRLNLETCCLKSMKYLVKLLYYIIQRFWEDGTELKKKSDFYISLRELKIWILLSCFDARAAWQSVMRINEWMS